MRLFRRFLYRLSKAENAGVLFGRARSLLAEMGCPEPRVLFYLGEGAISRVSAVERALKRFPELQRFQYTEDRHPEMHGTFPVLSNLPESWQDPNPNGETGDAGLDALQAIAQGIPRAYPFIHATFVFDRVDWFGTGADLGEPAASEPRPGFVIPGNHLLPSVAIESHWWVSRRQVALTAVVEVQPPGISQKRLPELPPDAQERLARLGKVHLELPIAAPSEEEAAFIARVKLEAQRLVEAAKANIEGTMAGIALPHELPPAGREARREPRQQASPKDALLAVFKPRGYKYQTKLSGQGGYTLVKRTATHNQIELFFDAGTWSGNLSAHLLYRGPLWSHFVPLRFAVGVPDFHWHSSGQERLEEAVTNIGAVVDHIERTLLPALDEVYGPAPAWFPYPP